MRIQFDNNTTGTPIPGATSSSYTPSTAVAGTHQIITVLLIYHRVDVILFIPIQPRLLFI